MPIITKIEVQKNNKERVNIYVDETFFMAIYKELVFTFNLKKGDLIDKEILEKILKDEMFLKGKNKALNILSKASQSEKVLRDKLSSDFEEDTIDEIMDFLKKYNFINDDELAYKIVNTNININKYGKNKIKQNLYNKGIEKSTIYEALSNIDQEKEFNNALYLAKKRYDRVKNEDPKKAYSKVCNHLAYKGFNYDIIKTVLNKIFKDDEYNNY